MATNSKSLLTKSISAVATAMVSAKDFIPQNAQSGVGLAIRLSDGRYLFGLAGSRFKCHEGTLFYSGIGGHIEGNETFEECAKREALEEIGCGIRLISSNTTWYIDQFSMRRIQIDDNPSPHAIFLMKDLYNTAVGTYFITIYSALLTEEPGQLCEPEVSALLALTPQQVARAHSRQFSIKELVAGGASIVKSANSICLETRVYPVGTALALAMIMNERPNE